MALGSLVDAGADVDEVRGLLDRLALPGWDLEFEDGLRGGIACTRAVVSGRRRGGPHPRRHRRPDRGGRPADAGDRSAPWPSSTRWPRSRPPCTAGPIDQVHFHEVGGHDAIIDIVGTAAALEVLGVDEVVRLRGRHRDGHGAQRPRPAAQPGAGHGPPARGIPTYGRDVGVELTTPTGAALLATLCTSFGPLPDMTIAASGFGGGAGEMDDLPNCTQVVIGRRVGAAGASGPGQPARRARDQPRRRHRASSWATPWPPRSTPARSTPGSARSP